MKIHLYKILSLFVILLLVCCNNTKEAKHLRPDLPTSENYSECIERVIKKDDSLGKIRNHVCEKISLALTIHQYTDNLSKLNYKNCPENFSAAFNRHRDAWNELIPVVNDYSELRGEMHDLFKVIEAGEDSTKFKKLVAKVWSTWDEVELARKK